MRAMLALGAALLMLCYAVPTTASAMEPGRREQVIAMAGKTRTDLCEYKECGGTPSAAEFAEGWAEVRWGGKAKTEYCTGPYGNGKTHGETQWACYGKDSGGFSWQVNVDPWGELTFYERT
jgi:hypothetical protein